jgi:hypothetical protein
MRHNCSRARAVLLVLLAACCQISLVALAKAADSQTNSLARQVDHIIIQSDDPEATFKLLSETLRLPIAWPFQSYGDFSSGAVNLGNVALEVIHLKDRRPGFTGVALEPVASESLPILTANLDARGVAHDAPDPTLQKDPSGKEYLAWTIIPLSDLPPAGAIFFCKYTFDLDSGRAKAAQALHDSGGGPVGVLSVKQLVIGAANIVAAQREWSRILGPPQHRGRELAWQVGAGPPLYLVAAHKDAILQLRLMVKSLSTARVFLTKKKLLGRDSGREITLNPLHTSGAVISFVE